VDDAPTSASLSDSGFAVARAAAFEGRRGPAHRQRAARQIRARKEEMKEQMFVSDKGERADPGRRQLLADARPTNGQWRTRLHRRGSPAWPAVQAPSRSGLCLASSWPRMSAPCSATRADSETCCAPDGTKKERLSCIGRAKLSYIRCPPTGAACRSSRAGANRGGGVPQWPPDGREDN